MEATTHETEMKAESENLREELEKKPTVAVFIGMAGSGKTTLLKSFWTHLKNPATVIQDDNTVKVREAKKTYLMNLDPAVPTLNYPVNIDIRDSVKYKDVMQKYKLGPNGAIMTCLNLFATTFEKAYTILNKRAPQLDAILVDTPGQIEVFNWSASGTVILDSLAISFPTIIIYIIDTPRCQNEITFIANMLHATGVLYKSKLPFLMIFNKTDIVSSTKCIEWLRNYDAYEKSIAGADTYIASLSRSCALVMNEFYSSISAVSVSAVDASGMEDLEKALQDARQEYFESYLPWLIEQQQAIKRKKQERAQKAEKEFLEDHI